MADQHFEPSPIEKLHGQWLVGRRLDEPAGQFERLEFGEACLFIHHSLRAIPVLASGKVFGWLVGSPVDLDKGRFVQSRYDIAEEPGNVDAWVEKWVYRLGGSFLFFLVDDHRQRLYLDCAGSLSAVYDPVARVAGATAEIILTEQEYAERMVPGRRTKFEVASEGWISGEMTAHRGLVRLLANHYLDLSTFTAVRHWPHGPLMNGLGASEAATQISAAALPVIEAAAGSPSAYVALTGGYDTRVLLSLCRDLRSRIEFVTIATPGSRRDIFIAGQLARRFGLQHRILPFSRATAGQRQAWDKRVGHVVTGANRTMHPSLWPLGKAILVGGVGGEVGRGFLWIDAGPTTPLFPHVLVDRLKLRRDPELLESVGHWLSGIPEGLNSLEVLDLAFIELRNSSWAFSQAYSNPLTIKLNPLNSRKSYEAMLASDPESRRGNLLLKTLIEQNWPELLTVPINKYGDIRDGLDRIALALRRPDRAFRKARQIVRARIQFGTASRP